MKRMQRLIPLLAIGGALALATPAAAAPSIAGGLYTGSGNSEVGGMISDAFSAPGVPATFQLTLGAPLSNSGGRYAATAELVGHANGSYLGGGVGVGQLKQNGSSGTVFVGILGTKVAPLTSVELRVYGSGASNGGSAAFLGLRLSL